MASAPTGAALTADALDYVFALKDFKVFGHGNDRNLHILDAPRLAAAHTGQVDVAVVMLMVATAAHAVLLHAASVVDTVEQSVLGKEGEGTEEGGLVDGVEQVLHVGETEGVGHLFAQRTPDKEAHSGYAHACCGEFGFVHILV